MFMSLPHFKPSSALPFQNMASKYHDDWQSSKKTVLQRNAYMFDNELMSDASFTCGESSRIFHAHKYVLATSSAVFFAMFYGDLAQKESPICLPDADEESFKEFLCYLYTDDCKITAENAIGILYLAKKYLMSSLTEKCCKVLEASIKPDNVFMVLEQAIQFDEQKLEAKCWDIVSKKTEECINSEAFYNVGTVGSHILKALLKSETLTVTEVELFKAVLKWVDSECSRQGMNIEEDKTARRRVLGDNVYELRFLEMSQEDFAKYVSSTGILTEAELVSIFQKFSGLDVAGLKWNKQKKRRPCMVGFSRFDVVNTKQAWNYNGSSSDALSLTVNKAILFHGVRLFGGLNRSQYQVKFGIKGQNVRGTYTSEQGNDGVWGYDVMLPKPVSLQPDEMITIIATIKGLQSHGGSNGKSSVKNDDTVVTFHNTPYTPLGLISNGTDKDGGQFYKIFLSKI
jgi:hypothetical protein